MPDENTDDDLPVERKDYSKLSIGDMLTRIQRKHIENLLTLVESGEIPNAQVLAQINRFLMDNGVTVAPSEQPKIIEGRRAVDKLPDFSGRNYNE